ncbi:hypothetical protein Gohar_018921, partial [Gossypium harknessii]|nr:hypothetical protein [Gossypium harknessii]
ISTYSEILPSIRILPIAASLLESIYGLVIFPKTLGHVDDAVSTLFDLLDKRVMPVLAILAKTFRSLSVCQRAGEGRFIGCAQLLLAWFHSHFWKVEKVSYRVFSEKVDDNSPYLQDEDVEWKAPWMIPDEILYRCGDFDWVPLLGIWGAIGYAPPLVLRQYRSRQFIPTTQGLAQCEFACKCDNYKKKNMISGEVNESMTMSLRQAKKIVKQAFEKKSSELGKMIEKLGEEKIQLRLDVDVQKLEAEKMRKGKNKAEEDLDSLKTDYKKLRLSIRTTGLGKISKQWRWIKSRVAVLEKSLHQHHSRNSVIELKASLTKIEELKGKIEELEAKDMQDQLQVQLQDQLAKVQQDMKDQIQEPYIPPRLYPSERSNPTGYLSTKSTRYQAGTLRLVNYPMGSGSNPRDNLTNPVVPNLDEMAEMDRVRVELPKQLKDWYKWLEEKFRAMESPDYL